jgi:hypothetical protein
VAASDARSPGWATRSSLNKGVPPWSDLPLWLPADVPGPILDGRRAQAAGLRCRPLSDTVRDVLGEDVKIQRVASGPPHPEAISRDRERELLRLWHATADPPSVPAALPHRTAVG